MGSVIDSATGAPISGATASLGPWHLQGVTGSDGSYAILAPEGFYSRLIIRAEGYIPDCYQCGLRNGANINVVPGETTFSNIHPLRPVGRTSGTVTLKHGDSYHFLAEERAQNVGGEFSVSLHPGGKSLFHANNSRQRGIQDLGDLGDISLDKIHTPESGYIRHNVPVVQGHIYVSLATEAEEGHFVVLRVIELVDGDHVTLEYLYTGTVAPPPTPTPTAPAPSPSPVPSTRAERCQGLSQRTALYASPQTQTISVLDSSKGERAKSPYRSMTSKPQFSRRWCISQRYT